MNTNALITLWNHTQQHPGTTGARVCASVLLGLYNGARFPMDLTDLRSLDAPLLSHAIEVITADSIHCQREVHTWLNGLSGQDDFGERFEWLAYDYDVFKKGRTPLKYMAKRTFGRYVFKLPQPVGPLQGKSARTMIVDYETTDKLGNPVLPFAGGDYAPESLARAIGEVCGVKIIENAAIPVGHAVVMQDGKPVGTFNIDAHARAMSTPHFNDLAG